MQTALARIMLFSFITIPKESLGKQSHNEGHEPLDMIVGLALLEDMNDHGEMGPVDMTGVLEFNWRYNLS